MQVINSLGVKGGTTILLRREVIGILFYKAKIL